MRLLFIFFIGTICLSGCRTLVDPTPMPAGYAYHQNDIKSPPGPEPSSIGYDYSDIKNDSILGEWADATDAFVMGLEQQTGLQPSPVYLQNKIGTSGFNHAYQHNLLESLRKHGYTIANAASTYNTRIVYEAIPTGNLRSLNPLTRLGKDMRSDDTVAQIPYSDFTLRAILHQGSPNPIIYEDIYTLPVFGYDNPAHVVENRFVKGGRTRNFEVNGPRNWNE